MRLTTVPVDPITRNLLGAQAERHGRSLQEHLQVLAEREERECREERDLRFSGLRAEIRATDPALLASHTREVAAWDSTLRDGLPHDEYN